MEDFTEYEIIEDKKSSSVRETFQVSAALLALFFLFIFVITTLCSCTNCFTYSYEDLPDEVLTNEKKT